MMSAFFDTHPSLRWEIKTIQEVSSNIVEINFRLEITKSDGIENCILGIERIVMENKQIHHIEVRNR